MISIIMPAYNVRDYIQQAIQSIQNQTCTDWELIVVNDGSTDGTDAVIRSINDSRIIYIDQENQGVSAARNKGIDKASGDYIAFLDGDDLWEPAFLSEMLRNIGNTNAIYCGHYTINVAGKLEGYKDPYLQGNILYRWLSENVFIQLGAVLVRKDFIDNYNIRFTQGCAYSEDREFLAKIFTSTKVNVIPRELIRYRQRQNSATHRKWHPGLIEHINALQRIRVFIENNYYGEDKTSILQHLQKEIPYRYYRYILYAIRNGFFDQAVKVLELIHDDLSAHLTDLSSLHKFKLSLILSKNQTIWKLIRYFS